MTQDAGAIAGSHGEVETKETRQKPSNALESNGIRRRLNQIDKVRARGIGEHIALPQLVVCGDQSAGKSSVLEGITRIPFPRNDGLCTKFATEIILRHSQEEYISIHASIIPHSSRLEVEALLLKEYHRELSGYEQLPEVIQEVSKLMGVEGPSFAADVLRIEVSGPTGLHLTVVDLPGLISGSDDNQIVESLVDAYLESPRTIILTVVPASSDIETQPIIRKARHFDTEGERTVGIITKPDLINKGTEGRVASLAKNQGATQLKLGFFLLKNPSPQDLAEGITPESRQQKETQFFKTPTWREHGLNFDRVGIDSLRSFLQSLLERHIEKALPDVRSEVSALLEKTQRRLDELGQERPEISDQRLFLSNLGMKFRLLVQSAVDGTYQKSAGDFFGHDEEHIHNRLRAEIHILNERFSDFMREHAHKFTTNERKEKKGRPKSNDYDNSCPLYMTGEAFLDWIMKVRHL